MDKQIQDSQEPAESTADKPKRRWIKNIPLLILELCVLAAAIGIMYVVVTATDEVERKACLL